MKERKTQNKKGFTLIEMMVSISLFAVVMVVVIAALLAVNNANKRAQKIRAVVDNLNYSIEDMARKIRTGDKYYCGNGWGTAGKEKCPSGDKDISFIGPPMGTTGRRYCYTYGLNGTKIERKEKQATSPDYKNCSSDSWGGSIQTIASEVVIDSLKFHVIQSDPALGSATQQPIVIITISGKYNIEDGSIVAPFSLQTTVSQRSATE